MTVSEESITNATIVSSLPDLANTTNRKWTTLPNDRPIPSSASSTTSATSDDSSFVDDSSITLPESNNTASVLMIKQRAREYNVSSVDSSIKSTRLRNTLFQMSVSIMVWSGMIVVPLLLSSPYSPISYKDVFPRDMYEIDPSSQYAHPLGILLGVFSIMVGHFLMVLFFLVYRTYANPIPIQTKGVTDYDFWEGVIGHAFQPKPNIVLGSYLLGTWICKILPPSYYNFHGTIQFHYLLPCLLMQDFVQYCMHRVVHSASGALYRFSHKRHHTFINPILFDTFKGTIPDTILTVLIPLTCTTQIMSNCNVWTFMAFGSIDISWGTLIHSEYILPWDSVFEKLKLGTPADHHVHHIFFNYNYGHLFMFWDILFGTYRSPKSFGSKTFNLPQQEKKGQRRSNKKRN